MIEAAEGKNQGELLALTGLSERKRRLTRLLADPEGQAEPQTEEAGSPDFDGGAREPAPAPTDPVADHNRTLLEYLQNVPPGGGGDW